jgi:hypothetical protein
MTVIHPRSLFAKKVIYWSHLGVMTDIFPGSFTKVVLNDSTVHPRSLEVPYFSEFLSGIISRYVTKHVCRSLLLN